ncbi:HAD hydrolase-like protein [Streptomyces anulatus]|uniref:HAD hydrolase-like protein n=1 Tax=Streptomyces anulatus TaxID=1892 RepID=A0A7K3RNA4_STRAQ|nr:haloacid dehalogenase-like hydrolase [Streptomyces anulatus]NEC03407.1 HAD hydrolase-like protein [Streptomyces anulatus]NED26161.1 HAD hydrolase-like protein [Streptomyces anulatus]
MKLVLWDIDHTLIATRGVGREIFAEAFEQVAGTPMREQATVDGMTEPVIFRRTAELHGITSDRTMFEEFARRSAEIHRRRAHDLRERGHALPGAAAALAALADMNGVVQSVVTGNIRPVAEVKLQVFGLDTHIRFPYGGYGEDHDDRAELVRTAIDRTRAATGADIALTDILLIGDTPADVAAGRAAGVPVLAIATGRTSAAELADAGATATVRDLQDAAPLRDLLR